MNLSLIPFILSREFTNDGKLASGAKIYTYASGTNTNKVTYKDAAGTIPNTNPIICDASGSFTCFLAAGAYRIKIDDQNDVNILPAVDGVIGGGSGGISTDSTASATLLQNYNELRALTSTPDLVYVAGRTVEGDGGQGWFQHIPGSSEIDDGSIILTAQSGSKVYKRIFDGFINPVWNGLKYIVAIDQTTALNQSMALSVKYGLPVYIQGPVYINTNVTIPTNSSLNIADNGYFFASSSKTITFADDSKLYCTDNAFGTFIQPKFGKRVVDEIKLSWMNGSVDDDRMDKLLLSSTDPNAVVVIDKSVSILASIWVFPNITKHTNSSIITFTGGSALSITAKYLEANPVKIYSTTASSYSFDFGSNYAFSEWFGAVGDGIVDDSSAFKYAAKSGKVELVKNKSYKIDSAVIPSTLEIKGSATITIGYGTSFSNTTLTMTEVYIVKTGGAIWYTGTNLFLYNCSIPSNYTVSGVKVVEGCSYTGESRYPIFDGTVGPSIYNAHLPLITSAPYLSTDANGKVFKRGSNVDHARFWSIESNQYTANNIKYANGVYFLLLNGSQIFTSTTGLYGSWTLRTMPNGGGVKNLYDVCWTGQNWVISGDHTILKSTGNDLSSWTFVDIGAWYDSGVIRQVASNGSGVVVAVAAGAIAGTNSGAISRSTDHGASWTVILHTSTLGDNTNCVTYANNKFVVGGQQQYWYSNDNGATWINKVFPQGTGGSSLVDTVYAISYTYGNWFFVGGNNTMTPSGGTLLANSFDLTNISYFNRTDTSDLNFGCAVGIKVVGDTLVAVTRTGNILTTNNLNTWTPVFSPLSGKDLKGIAGDGMTGFITSPNTQLKLELM